MDQVKVCRICLNMDIKMYDLRLYPLGHYAKSIETLRFMELPPYACVECATLIRNTYFFMEKCIRGQTALCNLMCSMKIVTENDVRKLNRHELNLVSNLSCHNVCEDSIINVSYEESEIFSVKHEICNEDVNDEPKYDINIDFVKCEIGNEETHFSSDDNKSIQELKPKIHKNKEKRADKAKNNTFKTEISDKHKKEPSKKPSPRKSRGKPRKAAPTKLRGIASTVGDDDDDNIEEYATIIVLSKEEQLQEIEKRKSAANYLNGSFKCEICFKGFISEVAYKNHLSRHDPERGDVECEICKFRFKFRRQMVHHAAIHATKYACKACSHVSSCRNQAKRHNQYHKGVKYTCQHCGEVSSTSNGHLSHLRLKHPSQFVCGACGYSFVSARGLALHRTMMHKAPPETDESKKITNDEQTDEATDKKTDEGPYCAECDVKFASQEAHRRHLVTSAKHTKEQDSKHGCRDCGDVFGSEEELRLHHRTHAVKPSKDYYKNKKTPHYRRSFPRTCTLVASILETRGCFLLHCTRHRRRKGIVSVPKKPTHAIKPSKNYYTNKKTPHYRRSFPTLCPASVESPRAYWAHFRRAHPGQRYPVQWDHVCDVCGKTFQTNASLKYHRRTHHTEERSFKCSLCPKAFYTRTNLSVHEKSHTDRRPFACELCNKSYKIKSALDRHLRSSASHEGLKPFKCEVCGKGFSETSNVRVHVLTVHLKQPAPYPRRRRRAPDKPLY